MPETRRGDFGTLERFKPQEIRIPSEFALVGAFMGSKNAFPTAPGGGPEIPGERTAPGMPQPDYPVAERRHVISVVVRNTSDRQRACRVSVVGKEVKAESNKPNKEIA